MARRKRVKARRPRQKRMNKEVQILIKSVTRPAECGFGDAVFGENGEDGCSYYGGFCFLNCPKRTHRPQPQKHAHRTPSKPEFLRFFAPFPLDFLPFRCIFSTTTSTRGERLHPLSPWDLTTMVIFLTFITPFSITVSSLISVIIINFEVVFPTLFKVFGCPSVVSL